MPSAGAADVTLRVEGKTANLVPATAVTLPAADVLKDGQHPCARDSFGGALQSAVGNDGWGASYNAGFGAYFLTSIKGFAPSGNDYFALWVNHKYTTRSVCDTGLQAGDDLLALVDYCDYDPAAQGLQERERAATGTRGAQDRHARGAVHRHRHALCAQRQHGARRGRERRRRDHRRRRQGRADRRRRRSGVVPREQGQLRGRRCRDMRDDRRRRLLRDVQARPDTTPAAGRITGMTEQQRFARGKGPRTLKGNVDADPSGIKSIELRLTRTDGRALLDLRRHARALREACSRCGAARGRWFSVGDRADWSYLLPSALGRGRYVLDVAGDRQGRQHRPAPCSARRNRVVFHVR